MMLLVVLMLWACATIKAQQVFKNPVVLYQRYANTGNQPTCTGNARVTMVYIQGVCFNSTYKTSIESDKVTCINNVPTRYTYKGSATCTGTPSILSIPPTCSR